MRRFVLLRRESGLEPSAREELERIPGVEIVDQTTGRAFLVEVDVKTQPKLKELLPGWVISEEVEYELPRDAFRFKKP